MHSPSRFLELRPLPLGNITARGWIRDQLSRSKAGMGGHLDELEPEMIRYPYLDRRTDEAWGPEKKAGWGAEISGNYWYGLILLAFTLDDPELQEKARGWVDGALANQRPDGYLGTYTESDDLWDDYNAWGTACGLAALLAYYDATRRPDVLDAVYRCLIWFCDNWAGDRKTRYAGQYLCSLMALGYRSTADPRLRVFIEEYVGFLNHNDLYLNSQNAMRSPDLVYNSNHAASAGLQLHIAALGYSVTGENSYLEAAFRFLEKLEQKVLMPTGGVASNTEYLSPRSSVTETEICAFTFLQYGVAALGAASGEARCFDIAERIAFNVAQGARKKDEKCVAYFTSGNQIFATTSSDFSGQDQGAYAPCHPISCCPVTSVWNMPSHVYSMGLTDDSGNLYIASYGPATIEADGLVLESDTRYPFRESVSFHVVNSGAPFRSVSFRIPGWCAEPQVFINDQLSTRKSILPGWMTVERVWTTGDTVEINLPMETSVQQLDDNDSWSHHPIVIERGPLVFSLPIPEMWNAISGNARTQLPAGWSWYNVEPAPVDGDGGDVYERNGLRKYRTGWNVAINATLDPRTISVEEHHPVGYAWEHPLITLKVPGYKAPYSYAPYIEKTHEVYQSPIYVEEPVILELAPYGCTNLRITYFPQAAL